MKTTKLTHALNLTLGLGVLAATLAMPAQAQQPPAAAAAPAQAAPALTPQQQAQNAELGNQMTAAANQVTQLVDAGRSGDVWDTFSAPVKQLVTKPSFVQDVAKTRTTLGALTKREIVRVSGETVPPNSGMTPGQYITVVYKSQFARRKDVEEKVSFRLDEDQRWRVTGYAVR